VRVTFLLAAACAATASAQQWELGANIGYGAYRNASIYSPGGKVEAGIRNRFAAGAVVGNDLYEYVSGEIRYSYQNGDPFLASGGKQGNMQGQSHSISYDLLFHLRPREERLRPYFTVGVGAKWFHTTGPAPDPQPFPGVATLAPADQWRALVAGGGGVKYDLPHHLRLRCDFLDYITPFPANLFVPVTGGTARGIFHQFTPSFGISIRM